MDLLEDMVFQQYQAVHIDASFPAESMYLKREYRIKTYEKIKTEGGDYLCYHTMEKVAGGKGIPGAPFPGYPAGDYRSDEGCFPGIDGIHIGQFADMLQKYLESF